MFEICSPDNSYAYFLGFVEAIDEIDNFELKLNLSDNEHTYWNYLVFIIVTKMNQ